MNGLMLDCWQMPHGKEFESRAIADFPEHSDPGLIRRAGNSRQREIPDPPKELHGGFLHGFPAGDAMGLAPMDRNGFGNGPAPVIQPFPSKGTSPLARVFCP
jgi:hypothetical protein